MSEKTFWKDRWALRNRKPANNFAKRAYANIKRKKFKTLLDVGSGDGRDTLYFAQKGLSVTALDFSKSGIELLKAANPDIKTCLVDIKKMNFAESSFDVIYAHLSLHYFNDKETSKIFQELHGTLKKGGLIFVKCKSVDDALYGQGKKVGPDMYQKGHLRHFFSREYMGAKMEKFKILKMRKTSSVYHSYKSGFIEVMATK